MPRFPRRTVLSLVFVCAMVLPAGNAVATGGPGSSDTTTDTVVDTVVDSVTDTTAGWRIENDPSECLGFLPKPGCGYEPTDAGERGGSLQITLFLVMIGALAVIGTVVARNIIRRDRAINAAAADRTTDAG